MAALPIAPSRPCCMTASGRSCCRLATSNALRRAMEQELRGAPRRSRTARAKVGLGLENQRRTMNRAQLLLRRRAGHCPEQRPHPERYELLLPWRMAEAPAAPGAGHSPLPPALALPAGFRG